MFRLGKLPLRKTVGVIMVLVFFVSLGTWLATRERLPERIRIATALPGGLYHKFGEIFREHLQEETGRPVTILKTDGSVENRKLLLEGKADLAVINSASVSMDSLKAVTPLWEEFVHVIVRRDSSITKITDLNGKKVALGPYGAGMRMNARKLLKHYRINFESLKGTENYFKLLMSDQTVDAAIVSTSFMNPDLEALLDTGKFRVLPILDGEAVAIRNPFFSAVKIPRGLYSEGPPIPRMTIPTVGSMAILACRADTSSLLVETVLDALYASNLRSNVPVLVPPEEAQSWHLVSKHPAAAKYFNPYEGIGVLASFMESIAATKELLFALGALIYLLCSRWRQQRERVREAEVKRQRDQLERYLEETIRIERMQMTTEKPEQLRGFLDDVTRLKLKALSELSHEDLRGDRFFSIFLMQCANLIRKIQSKLELYSRQAGQ